MTTVLADWHKKVMVSDSKYSTDDRVWRGRKIWRIRGTLVGCAGNEGEIEAFIDWYRDMCEGRPRGSITSVEALVMSQWGLQHYVGSTVAKVVATGIEAIGSGAKAAMVAYEITKRVDPVAVVKVVCRHDAGSGPPVKIYTL